MWLLEDRPKISSEQGSEFLRKDDQIIGLLWVAYGKKKEKKGYRNLEWSSSTLEFHYFNPRQFTGLPSRSVRFRKVIFHV